MLRNDSPDHDGRFLIRLRWGLRVTALTALGSLALLHILGLRRPLGQVFIDLAWGCVISLGIIEICFRVIFHLYHRLNQDRQRLLDQSLHLRELEGVGRRLLVSLRGQASDDRLPQGALSQALSELMAMTCAERASLLLLDDDDQPQQFIHVGLSADAQPGSPPPASSLHEPTAVDLTSERWSEFLLPGYKPARAFVAVPVIAGERLWGYFAAADGECATPQAQSLIHSFAANLGMILENVTLFRETRRKLAEASTLMDVSHAISSKLTQEDLLPYLAENLARILKGTGSIIFLRHPHTGDLYAAASFGLASDRRSLEEIGERYLPLAEELIATGRPIAVPSVKASDHVPPSQTQSPADRSWLGLPLSVTGKCIGAVIITESRQERDYSENDVSRAVVLTNQGAVAIANARLFREAERRLVELGTLAEISRVIFSPLRFPDIYQRVVDELARAFGYPFVAFYQVQEEQLDLGAQFGFDREYLPKQIAWGEGAIGQAAATGETVYALDAAELGPGEAARGTASQIAMPLLKDSLVLGVLSVESFEPLTEADLSLLQSLSYQVSMAIENARLLAAEKREREVARTLLQIAGDLSGTLELDEVLKLILERLRVVLPYESAAIGLLAGDVCYLAAAHDMPRARRLWGTSLPPDELPFVARVLDEQSAVIIQDTQQSADWVVIEGSQDIRSWLGVPLVVQDRTIGLLMINHLVPNFYDQDSARLALAFAQHAALAIDNARLYEQTQAKLSEQTLLHEMTAAVSSTLDAGRILRLLAEHLITMLGVTSTRIATLADDMRTATVVADYASAQANEAERAGQVGDSYQLAAFPITTAKLAAREPLLVTAGDESEEWRTRMAQQSGRAMLLLPLVARDRVTGFVELWDSRSRRRFTEAEVTLAQTLINQAAVAVDNARLFAETQRSISEMMLLYDIAVAAASTLDLDTILQSLVKTLQFRVLEKSVVSVWLVDTPSKALELRAFAGEIEGVSYQESLPLNGNLCSEVVKTGQPIVISDATQEGGFPEYNPAIRSIMCVPLALGQRVIGVLQALSAQEGSFTGHDLRLLRTMAGSLAIAIENVRLFSELKRSEAALVMRNQALKRANDRLQELDRLKSAFIASVSHELRTPLNSIIGFSEVLLDGLGGDLQSVAHEYVGYIHGSGKHLLDLINDILDLSKIQAGRMSLKLDDVSVMQIVEEVRAALAPTIVEKQQTLTIKQSGAVPEIVADQLRLKQVFFNLLGNACKFTQPGGKIAVDVVMADPTTLRIDVNDNGPGISLEDQAIIFEEFRQARITRLGEGTGLGLAISRRLVELHSGRIWVDSEPGAGATFTVLLPISGPEPEQWDNIEDREERYGAAE